MADVLDPSDDRAPATRPRDPSAAGNHAGEGRADAAAGPLIGPAPENSIVLDLVANPPPFGAPEDASERFAFALWNAGRKDEAIAFLEGQIAHRRAAPEAPEAAERPVPPPEKSHAPRLVAAGLAAAFLVAAAGAAFIADRLPVAKIAPLAALLAAVPDQPAAPGAPAAPEAAEPPAAAKKAVRVVDSAPVSPAVTAEPLRTASLAPPKPSEDSTPPPEPVDATDSAPPPEPVKKADAAPPPDDAPSGLAALRLPGDGPEARLPKPRPDKAPALADLIPPGGKKAARRAERVVAAAERPAPLRYAAPKMRGAPPRVLGRVPYYPPPGPLGPRWPPGPPPPFAAPLPPVFSGGTTVMTIYGPRIVYDPALAESRALAERYAAERRALAEQGIVVYAPFY